AATKSAGKLQADGNGHRRLHDKIAVALAGKIEHRRLTREKAALRCGYNRSAPAVAPGLDAFVEETRFVRCAAPGRRSRAVFRPAGCYTWDDCAAAAWRWRLGWSSRSRWNPDVCERVEESGIHRESFAVDDPGILRHSDIFADCHEYSLGDHHGCGVD